MWWWIESHIPTASVFWKGLRVGLLPGPLHGRNAKLCGVLKIHHPPPSFFSCSCAIESRRVTSPRTYPSCEMSDAAVVSGAVAAPSNSHSISSDSIIMCRLQIFSFTSWLVLPLMLYHRPVCPIPFMCSSLGIRIALPPRLIFHHHPQSNCSLPFPIQNLPRLILGQPVTSHRGWYIVHIITTPSYSRRATSFDIFVPIIPPKPRTRTQTSVPRVHAQQCIQFSSLFFNRHFCAPEQGISTSGGQKVSSPPPPGTSRHSIAHGVPAWPLLKIFMLLIRSQLLSIFAKIRFALSAPRCLCKKESLRGVCTR